MPPGNRLQQVRALLLVDQDDEHLQILRREIDLLDVGKMTM
jgi:hypothetical protein